MPAKALPGPVDDGEISAGGYSQRIGRHHMLVKYTETVGDIFIIFPCSFAVGITQQYGIYVLLG